MGAFGDQMHQTPHSESERECSVIERECSVTKCRIQRLNGMCSEAKRYVFGDRTRTSGDQTGVFGQRMPHLDRLETETQALESECNIRSKNVIFRHRTPRLESEHERSVTEM